VPHRADGQALAGSPWHLAIWSRTKTDFGHTALAWGDPETGPHGSFNRFPAGSVIPPHTHSHDNQLIVVEGLLHNYRLSDEPDVRARAYPTGSFLYEIGNTPLVIAVDPSAPCTVYVTQNGPLDFTMVQAPDPGYG
jgi:hypothetical protein